MPKLMLCRGAFTDEYVARIRAQATGWHCVETRSAADDGYRLLSPDILIVVSGSVTQQKTQSLKVRFVGGAAAGAFTVPLVDFAEFLETLRQKQK